MSKITVILVQYMKCETRRFFYVLNRAPVLEPGIEVSSREERGAPEQCG